MQELIIDPEFKKLIAPLSHDEYKLLEASIIEDGCRDALVVWHQEEILVDGHHRHKICTEHGIEYETTEYDFDDRNDATKWIYDNQLGRRNLTDEYRTYILGARLELEEVTHGGARYHCDTLNERARERVSIDTGKSEATIVRAKKYKEAVDRIAEHSDTVKDAILRGETGATKKDIIQFGAVQRDNPELGKLAVDELLTGNVTGFKHAIYNGKKNHQLIHQSKSNEWYTPSEYIEAARVVMGSIDLDPASCEYANKVVQAGEFFDIEEDGLTASWFGNVWLNPPYGRGDGNDSNQSIWSNKIIAQYEAGAINQGILLVNAAPGSLWFYPLWDYTICFPKQRIRFNDENGASTQPTHGNALVYFGSCHQKFFEVFKQFGAIMTRIGNDNE